MDYSGLGLDSDQESRLRRINIIHQLLEQQNQDSAEKEIVSEMEDDNSWDFDRHWIFWLLYSILVFFVVILPWSCICLSYCLSAAEAIQSRGFCGSLKKMVCHAHIKKINLQCIIVKFRLSSGEFVSPQNIVTVLCAKKTFE